MGRLGLDLDLGEGDAIGRNLPVVVDLKLSGTGYMEDLHRAGGMPHVLCEVAEHLRGDAATVTAARRRLRGGHRAGCAHVSSSGSRGRGAGRPAGNLAARGVMIEVLAASPKLMVHQGRAVVFESVEDTIARIDRDDLRADPSGVLVLQTGRVGGPSMPEAGCIPIPRPLARAGVRDMVRISDARMSGTAFGEVVMHVTAAAAVAVHCPPCATVTSPSSTFPRACSMC
jgi:dihydroxy-acid dehydratase